MARSWAQNVSKVYTPLSTCEISYVRAVAKIPALLSY